MRKSSTESSSPSAAPEDSSATAAQFASTQAAPVATKSSSGSHGGLWLLVLIMLGAFSFLAWKGAQRLDLIASVVEAQNNEQLAQNEHAQAHLNELFALQKKQNQAELIEFNERLENLSARVLAATTLNRDDYKIFEVDYLLRMANQRILVEREASNALALADTANGVLGELESSDLFAARKKLTQEIQALKMASKVDRQGIYLKLQAITQQIENLPLIDPIQAEDETDAAASDEDGLEENHQSLWQRFKNFGKSAWHKFGGYVRVRDQGRRVDAILPPEDQMYLRQNLRLMLEQAEIGLLREEQHVYEASLDKAEAWIHDYYPLNDQSQIVVNDLEILKRSNIQQPLPDFTGSAALVKDYIRQKDRLAQSRRGGH